MSLETDPRYHLSKAEEEQWQRVKRETPTKDDWKYLQELITLYQRRRISNCPAKRIVMKITKPEFPANRVIKEGREPSE